MVMAAMTGLWRFSREAKVVNTFLPVDNRTTTSNTARSVKASAGTSTGRARNAARRDSCDVASLANSTSAALSARAAYDEAVAAVGVAKLNLARTEVRAPVNGHVTNLLVDRGDYATAGGAMLAIVDSLPTIMWSMNKANVRLSSTASA